MSGNKLTYRPEIDGLRCVAVLPVILFHAGFEAFSGGFIGVDIFFVISGFLITSIILNDIENGGFSIVRFYERRIRRIIPALFFVILCCLPFAWLWMLPEEFESFGKSIFSVNIFISNVFFWQEIDYFGGDAELKPLLHTWSLSVEEQFYVLFPAFLALLHKKIHLNELYVILFIVLASLLCAEWASRTHPDAAFYLLPTRAWELGVGASLALLMRRNDIKIPRMAAQFLSLIGVALILASIFLFDQNTPFPGVFALLPVLSTALIIMFAHPGTYAHSILSSRVFVGIGLISYSAYLWHQPLFSFARLRTLDEVPAETYLALSILSLLLAWGSWAWVERPFRNRQWMGQRRIFVTYAASSVILAIISAAIISGFAPQRHAGAVDVAAHIMDQQRPNYGLSRDCQPTAVPPHLPAICYTDPEPRVLVWGDSHAMQYVQGILASNPNARLLQLTKAVCGPFLDIAPIVSAHYNKTWAHGCRAVNNQVKAYVERTPSLRYALLASPFRQYVRAGGKVLVGSDVYPADVDAAVAYFEATLKWLRSRGIQPVVFGSPPRGNFSLGLCLARSTWIGHSAESCSIPTAEMELLDRKLNQFLDALEKNGTKVIRLSDILCDQERCRSMDDGVALYRDAGHLSIEGARHLGKKYDFYELLTNPNARAPHRE